MVGKCVGLQVYAFKDLDRVGRQADLVQMISIDHRNSIMGPAMFKTHADGLLQSAAIDELKATGASHLFAPHDRNSKLCTLQEFVDKYTDASDCEDEGREPKRRRTSIGSAGSTAPAAAEASSSVRESGHLPSALADSDGEREQDRSSDSEAAD